MHILRTNQTGMYFKFIYLLNVRKPHDLDDWMALRLNVASHYFSLVMGNKTNAVQYLQKNLPLLEEMAGSVDTDKIHTMVDHLKKCIGI
jgi:hypothetical protein